MEPLEAVILLLQMDQLEEVTVVLYMASTYDLPEALAVILLSEMVQVEEAMKIE